jgi:aspartyl protease family protein
MIIAAWLLLLLVLLTMFFYERLEDQRNPNRNLTSAISVDGARQVTLLRNRRGHYLAHGRLNGAPVQFLIDTGATDVAISEDEARSLGLRFGPRILVSTARGTTTAYQTNIDRVELGEIVLHDVQATIVPDMPSREVLLGMSFLKHLEIFQHGHVLTLRQPGSAM